MKFLCDNCKAKYQIADEKIAGRTLRMKCRRCEHDIIIRGEGMAAGPAAGRSGGRSRPSSSVGAAPRRPGRADRSSPSLTGMRRSNSGLGADFRRQVDSRAPGPPQPSPLDQWHVAINDVPVGPVKRDEIARKIGTGAVGPDSLAWREGFDDWRPVRDIPELSALLRHRRPPPPAVPRVAPAARPPRPPAPRSAPPPPRGRPASNVIPITGRLGAAAAPAYEPEIEEEKTLISDGVPSGMLPGSSAPAAGRPGSQAPIAPPPNDFAPTIPDPTPGPSPALAPAASTAGLGAPALSAEYPAPRRGLPVGAWIAIVGAASFGVALAVMVGTKLLSEPTEVAQNQDLPDQPETPAPLEVEPDLHPDEAVAEEPAEEPEAQPEDVEEGASTPGGSRPGSSRPGGTRPTGTGGQMTEEERQRMARMAADTQEEEQLPGNVRVPTGSGSTGTGGSGRSGEGLTEQQLRNVVGSNRPSLRRCYEQAIRGMGDPPTVRINVELTVGASGVVTGVRASGNNIGSLNGCIESAVRRWRFPSSGNVTRTTFPVVFQPGT